MPTPKLVVRIGAAPLGTTRLCRGRANGRSAQRRARDGRSLPLAAPTGTLTVKAVTRTPGWPPSPSQAGLRCRNDCSDVGGSGLLGTELVRQARTAGQTIVATYATKPGPVSPTSWCHLDLRDAGRLDAVMSDVRPQLVVNAPSGSADWATTAEGPIGLAMVAAKYGIRIVHVSSDAVFSVVISGHSVLSAGQLDLVT
ncbi:sugar nucleotide-binding protein [Streptomyces sp. NPDC001568]|uniref:sugar nucleotide-binding protein n=1 Tax=Streptomyces sp. NPDC001568 TaxID=3364588 RepID=UPI0036BEDC59